MSHRDYKALLLFSEQWFSLGVVTKQDLEQIAASYEASEDKNSEHYRYGAFRRYLSQHRPLSPPMAEALYELGNSDPDYSMGGAIMADILQLPECLELPECLASVMAKAGMSERKHLIRITERKKSEPGFRL